MDIAHLARIASGLLVWMATVHLPLAFGVRRGELVWSGRYSRRMPPDLRRRSLAYGLLLVYSAWVIAAMGGVVGLSPITDAWLRSAGWVVTVFLGVAALYSLLRGSLWERFLLGPMALYGSVVAGWLTFG
jgi:hypothetical protein